MRRSSTKLTATAAGIFSSRPALAGFDIATVEVMALRVFRRGSFHPYLGLVSASPTWTSTRPDPSLRDNDRVSLALAGGARFYLARWVGFRFDVRGRGVYLGARWEGDEGWRDHGRWLVNGETQLGVFFSFGG